MSTARVIRVLLVEDTIGKGTPDDICQRRQQLYTLDGRALAMTTAMGDMKHVYSDNWHEFEREKPE